MAVILVVEDESSLAATISYSLRREGYQTLVSADGVSAIEQARSHRPDLILLDVMLPKLDGFEVCRTLRRESNVPIVMLTARNEEIDRVVGLEIGADDYVTKPFSMRELMARVKAMLRRAQMIDQTQAAEVFQAGDLEVDVAQRIIRLEGEAIRLKPKEFDLLAHLVRNPRRVFSRDLLLEAVWGYDFVGDARTVDVHIRWLREKIESDPSHPRRIETVRGIGYRFIG